MKSARRTLGFALLLFLIWLVQNSAALAQDKSLPQRLVTIKAFVDSDLAVSVNQNILNLYLGGVIGSTSSRLKKEFSIELGLAEIATYDFRTLKQGESNEETDREKILEEIESLRPAETADILLAVTAKDAVSCSQILEEGVFIKKCRHIGGWARVGGSAILLIVDVNRLQSYTNIASEDSKLLLHEIAHAFYAIHVKDKKSIMNEEVLGDEFDEMNREIILKNRFKKFR